MKTTLLNCRRNTILIYALIGVILMSGCGGTNEVANNSGNFTNNGDNAAVAPTESTNSDPSPTITAPEETDPNTFHIVPAESEVRFIVDEVLLGQDKTVIGITQSVTGDILADFGNLQNRQVTIIVDLSTLVTDSSKRNKTLKNTILESNKPDYQYGEFVSTELFGLPDTVEAGASYTVQLTGDLTVHGVTESVTFEGAITVESETRMSGSFEATIFWADYVSIFRLPQSVASIEDDVILQIDFVAEK